MNYKLLLSLALVSSSLSAWPQRPAPIQDYSSTDNAPPVAYGFALYPNQKWLMEESYLFMKPFQGDLDYGTKTLFLQPDDHTRSTDIKTKKPSFQWDSGVRVALGTYLPSSDRWDFRAVGTYFYGDVSQSTSANTAVGQAFNPAFLPDLAVALPVYKDHFRWQLNYFTSDLEVGREYQLTPRLVFHPFFGARGAFIYQDAQAHDSASDPDPLHTPTIGTSKLHLEQDFYGVGPRVGTRFNYYLSTHWQILGNFAASFLYAHYSVREKFTLQTTDVAAGLTFNSSNKAKDKDETIKTNLEGSLGLGWETWVNRGTVRIAPSILFEGTFWLDMNKLFTYQMPSLQNLSLHFRDFDTKRRHGNFGLIGASFNFHVDF